MDQNLRSWRRGTNSFDSFRDSKGDTPVKTRDLGGETNNLNPQRTGVSFAVKADGIKAFVTAMGWLLQACKKKGLYRHALL